MKWYITVLTAIAILSAYCCAGHIDRPWSKKLPGQLYNEANRRNK